ncbi:MAG: hypothetical protein RJB11_2260, partial [Planctomycetota bacterium]
MQNRWFIWASLQHGISNNKYHCGLLSNCCGSNNLYSCSCSCSKTRESIQGDRLFKEAGTPVFGPNVNYIPIRPFEHEHPRMVEPYFEKYLRRVDPSVDPMEQLVSQSEAFVNWASSVDSAQTLVLHDPYTWSLREVLKHICDCERVFAFRALWIARGGNDS